MNFQPRSVEREAVAVIPAVDQPIRADVLPDDRLRKLGESLAKGEVDSYFGLTQRDFLARNRENAQRILDVYRELNAVQSQGDSVTPAAQWLLDNNYLIEETIFQI